MRDRGGCTQSLVFTEPVFIYETLWFPNEGGAEIMSSRPLLYAPPRNFYCQLHRNTPWTNISLCAGGLSACEDCVFASCVQEELIHVMWSEGCTQQERLHWPFFSFHGREILNFSLNCCRPAFPVPSLCSTLHQAHQVKIDSRSATPGGWRRHISF